MLRQITKLVVIYSILSSCSFIDSAEGPTQTANSTIHSTPSPAPLAIKEKTLTPESSLLEEVAIENEPWYGLSTDLNDFPLVEKDAISSQIIPKLEKSETLLDPNASKVNIRLLTDDTAITMLLPCNHDRLNCAVAAHFRINDQGKERFILIWEVKFSEDKNIYLATYFHDNDERIGLNSWDSLIADPIGLRNIHLELVQADPEQKLNNPYRTYLITKQPGYSDAISSVVTMGNLEELKGLILPGSW